MKTQLKPGIKTADEMRAQLAIGPIQSKLVGRGGDRMGAAIRLKTGKYFKSERCSAKCSL